MKRHWLIKSRIVKTLATAFIFSQLIACGGGDGNSTSSGNGTETALANAVEITGSVGDGPIIGATVEVYSADGVLLDTTLTDSRSSYTKKIKAKGRDFPLTIKATSGTDLVTGAAPDFDLYSLMMSPSQKIVNLNPYTMFVMKIATDMPGGINDGNVESAMASVSEELGYGIDPGLIGNLISDQVNESTVANVVKGSEVLSEMIRRTRDKYLVTGAAITANEVIAALAADMTDGVLDGKGVSGINPRITAIAKVVSAQVLLEASRNKLKVGGLIATGMIDQAITTTQPGISPSQLTSSVRATPRMMKQTRVSLAAAQVLAPSEELSQLTAIVDSIPDNALANEIDEMLPVNAEELLDYPVGQSSIASDQDVVIINGITEPVLEPDLVAPANTAPMASAVAITGTLEVGQKLTGSYTYTDADGDAEGASTYRWLRDGLPISGVTELTYTLVTADEGASIVFEVTPVATAGALTGRPVASAPVGPVVKPDPVGPANTAPVASAVTITGSLEVGQKLTGSYAYADADGDAEGTSTYRWLRDGSPISGVTGLTYTLVTADQGASIVFEVTPMATAGVLIGSPVASAPVGPVVTPAPVAPANTAPVASAVAITGILEVGQKLTGRYTYTDADGDAEGTSTYRWLRDGSPISGVTGLTYTLVTADQGASIVFEVTPMATAGVLIGSPVASAPVGPVAKPNPVGPANTAPVISTVAITGTLKVGQKLTGSYTYADADGDTEGASTYRWLRDGSPISGVTGLTYTLVTADQGASIVFAVTPVAQTGASPGATVQSAAVGPVAAANNTATSKTHTEEFSGPFPSWSNVKTFFGAMGDGVTDDTMALQSAIDSLDSAHPVIYLPAGTYRITSTLNIVAKAYVAIIGEDPETTKIVWDGATSGTMIYANGVARSKINRLTFDGQDTAAVLVDESWDRDSSTGYFDTGNEYADLIFQNGGIGLRGGHLGHGFAEISILRCKFLDLTTAGVSLEDYNAIDVWVWYSYFSNCGYGVTNSYGAGKFNVYNSIFDRSTTADIGIVNNGAFNLRENYSSGSKQFLLAGSPAAPLNLTIVKNTILDTNNPVSIQMHELGPLILIDNVIRSKSGFTDGMVVDAYGPNYKQAEFFSMGNTFTATNALSSNGRLHTYLDKVVDRATINPTAPTLPDTPAFQNRHIYEITAGSSASTIQGVIDTAYASSYDNPIIHLQAGSYSISTTLSVPANRDLQIIGDGFNTNLNWSGAGQGPVLQLNGPSHVVLRDFYINGNNNAANAIVVNNADQEGGSVFVEQALWNNSTTNLKVDGLDYTVVELHDHQQYGHSESNDTGTRVIGGTSAAAGNWLGGEVKIIGGLTTGLSESYNVSNGAHLSVHDIWCEGGNTGERSATVSDNSYFTMSGSPTYNYLPDTLYSFENFTGKAAIINVKARSDTIDNYIEITGTSTDAEVLALGPVAGYPSIIDTSSPVATTGILVPIQNPGEAASPVSESGSSSTSFLVSTLNQFRAERSSIPKQRTSGVTDVRMYRVTVGGALTGVTVKN